MLHTLKASITGRNICIILTFGTENPRATWRGVGGGVISQKQFYPQKTISLLLLLPVWIYLPGFSHNQQWWRSSVSTMCKPEIKVSFCKCSPFLYLLTPTGKTRAFFYSIIPSLFLQCNPTALSRGTNPEMREEPTLKWESGDLSSSPSPHSECLWLEQSV